VSFVLEAVSSGVALPLMLAVRALVGLGEGETACYALVALTLGK
jgi:hypothetical protein